MTGGPQEHMKRAGTENLAGILGLAKAIQILKVDQEKISKELRDLRTLFEAELQRNLPQILINGEGPRVSNTVNIAFEGVDAETLLIQLDLNGIAASHGSACSSGSMEPSRVLIQMGLDPKRVRSSIRFSLSRLNTKEEIINAVQKISFIVNNLRG